MLLRLSSRHEVSLLAYRRHPLASRARPRPFGGRLLALAAEMPARGPGSYFALNAPQALAALARASRDADVVVHANIIFSLAAALAARASGTPAVMDYLDHYPESAAAYYRPPLDSLAGAAAGLAVSAALRLSWGATAASHHFARQARRLGARRVWVVPNGVDPGLFRPLDASRARGEIGLPEDSFIILYHGSLDSWVDLDSVARAVSRLRSRGLDATALLLGFSHSGRPPGRGVVALPPVDYERVPLYIAASDVVVAPYKPLAKNETVPLKALEALACARPVVLTPLAEFRRWMDGLPVVYASPRGLAGALERLARDPPGRGELERASALVRDRFSWDRIASELEGVLRLAAGEA